MWNRLGAVVMGLVLLTAVGCQSGKSLGRSVGGVLRAPYDLTLGQLFTTEVEEKKNTVLIGANEAFRLGYTPRWGASLGMTRSDRLTSVMLLDDLIVTLQRPTNLVSAVNVRDGIIRWQRVIGTPADVLFEPVRMGEQVLINSETHLYTLSAETGRLVQDTPLFSTTIDRPAVMETLVIFGGLNGRIFAIDTRSNQKAWDYDMTEGIVVRPVVSGFNVFVTDANGVYAMFQAMTGLPLWKGRTYGRNSATPQVSSLGVFLASEDQTLYALNRSTGVDRWKYRSEHPLRQSPTLVKNTVFIADPGVGLVALDAINGNELWQLEKKAQPVAETGGRLVLNEYVRLSVVDPRTGKTIVESPVTPLRTVLEGPNDSLILVTDDGRLMRLDSSR